MQAVIIGNSTEIYFKHHFRKEKYFRVGIFKRMKKLNRTKL